MSVRTVRQFYCVRSPDYPGYPYVGEWRTRAEAEEWIKARRAAYPEERNEIVHMTLTEPATWLGRLWQRVRGR